MKPSLPTLLSFNGGYVDTAGYIALQGLFTAHVTGNFVTIGSALVFGTSGVVAKLLALPVFCAVIIVTRVASFPLPRNRSALQTMLTVKLMLLMLGAYLAIRLGPFVNGDAWPAILTGIIATSDEEIVSANDQAFRVPGIFLTPDRAASVVDMNVGEGPAGCGNSMCRKNNFQRDEDRPSH